MRLCRRVDFGATVCCNSLLTPMDRTVVARSVGLVMTLVAGCIDEPAALEPDLGSTEEELAWDGVSTPIPRWACEMPTGQALPATGEGWLGTRPLMTWAQASAELQLSCRSCHSGSDAKGAQLHRWDTDPYEAMAFAPQMVKALGPTGGMRAKTVINGPTAADDLHNFFLFCANRPLKDVTGTTTRARYLNGRTNAFGSHPSPQAIEPCISFEDPSTPGGGTNSCFADKYGLVTSSGRSEADDFFYNRSLQGGAALDTLDEWKDRFDFRRRAPGESLADFNFKNTLSDPTRLPIAAYVNVNELNLGRLVSCSEVRTVNGGMTSGCEGNKCVGDFGCWVSNYGTSHGDTAENLRTAILSKKPKGTVVISYQKKLEQQHGTGYAVQFGSFDAKGDRINYAQLDYQGQRPVPNICMTCHGGTYDATKHLAYRAKLLPISPAGVQFSDDAPYRAMARITDPSGLYSRATLAPFVRKINEFLYQKALQIVPVDSTPASNPPKEPWDRLMLPAQMEWVSTVYDSNASGQLTAGPFPRTPESFYKDLLSIGLDCTTNPTDQTCMDRANLYQLVIQPYCIGCHNAFVPFASAGFPTEFQTPLLMSYASGPSRYNPFLGWQNSPTVTSTVDYGGANPFVTYKTFANNYSAIAKYFLNNARMPASEHALKKFHSDALTDSGVPGGTSLSVFDVNGTWRGAVAPWWTPNAVTLLNMIMGTPTVFTSGSACTTDSECGDPSKSGRVCASVIANGPKSCMDGCTSNVGCPSPSAGLELNRTQCTTAPADGLPHAATTCQACGRLGQPVCTSGALCAEGLNSSGSVLLGGECVRPTFFAVYRPSNQEFIATVNNINDGRQSWTPGAAPVDPAIVPLLGDYNGDGVTDYAQFQSDSVYNRWSIRLMDNEQLPGVSFLPGPSLGNDMTITQFSSVGEIPLAGDFDGDHITDLITYSTQFATFSIRKSRDGTTVSAQMGPAFAQDVPLVGDADGDGRDDLIIFRPNESSPAPVHPRWYIWSTTLGFVINVAHIGTQTVNVQPVVADFTGDGHADLGTYERRFDRFLRRDVFVWNILDLGNSNNTVGKVWGDSICGGGVYDKPVPGDYNGDGRTDIAIYRPCTGHWWVDGIGDMASWGAATDIPLVNHRGPW